MLMNGSNVFRDFPVFTFLLMCMMGVSYYENIQKFLIIAFVFTFTYEIVLQKEVGKSRVLRILYGLNLINLSLLLILSKMFASHANGFILLAAQWIEIGLISSFGTIYCKRSRL